MFLSEVASVRIRIGGTIAQKPWGMHFIVSLKLMRPLAIKYMTIITRATIAPKGSPTVASQLEKASMIDAPFRISPVYNMPAMQQIIKMTTGKIKSITRPF